MLPFLIILPSFSWGSDDSVVGKYEFRERYDDLFYFLELNEDHGGSVREVIIYGDGEGAERHSEIQWKRYGSKIVVTETKKRNPWILRGRTEFRIQDDGSLITTRKNSHMFKFKKATANNSSQTIPANRPLFQNDINQINHQPTRRPN